MPTAIVIGAGVGGVATAARLAKAGFDVTVFEKNDFTGGRCSLLHHEGYRFDTGPSLLLLPSLFRETFADLASPSLSPLAKPSAPLIENGNANTNGDVKRNSDGMPPLIKCNPNYTIHFHDAHSFTLSTDLAVMKRELELWEGEGAFSAYLGFMKEAHDHYELSVQHVLKRNFTSLFSMLRPAFLRQVLRLHPFHSVWGRASVYFKSERLRRVFTFGAMYMGMSPFTAPGTYTLLQYTELAEGIWYPVGGFHSVIQALINIGSAHNVQYELNTPVTSVLLSPDGGTARGVCLGDGREVYGDVVVYNADLVYAFRELIPPALPASFSSSALDALLQGAGELGKWAGFRGLGLGGLEERETSCSSISFYWAMDRVVPELGIHNVFLSEDYHASFTQIFSDHAIPSKLSFYVNVPSRADRSAAPEGCDAVVILVPVGHLRGGQEDNDKETEKWARLVDETRAQVLHVIRQRLGVDLSIGLVHEKVHTPSTWRETFNLDKGAILGLSHSFFNVLSFRPRTRHPSIQGCYFVGASTHPGTGVPICLAGAKLTATQILEDLSVGVPWPQEGEGGYKPGRADDLGVAGAGIGSRTMVLSGWAVLMLVLILGMFWQRF